MEKELVALGKTKTALKEDLALAVVVSAARPLLHQIGYDRIRWFSKWFYDVYLSDLSLIILEMMKGFTRNYVM